jgi:fatty-acyl-CoA synthase
MLILQLAAARAGAVFVPLNWRLAPAELSGLAADAQPALLFHEREFTPPSAVTRALPITGLLELGKVHDKPAPTARRAFDETTTLLYTSGTSGKPKGVMLSDANLFWGSLNFGYGYELSTQSVSLCDMPLFHTAGLHGITRSTIQAGGCVLISRGFDPQTTLARLTDATLGVTHYMCVPQMASRLWNEPGFAPEKLRNLRAWAIGGAPNPKAQVERFVDAGIRMSDGFGMSETCSNFGMPAHDLAVVRRKAGSCGLPFIALEAKVVDELGREVKDGQTGELCVRGPSVSRGYWNQPETTAKAFRDGWFCTGDAAQRDADGFYFIVDRRKDMYISGGENVYPAEVEAVVAELESVAECAVIGVPDAGWGEVGRAYVVPVPGHTITPAQIAQHCTQRLAKFKLPKSIIVTDVLPRTASGKVQKHVLKLRAAEERGPGDQTQSGPR